MLGRRLVLMCALSGCNLYFGGDDNRSETSVDAGGGGGNASPDAHVTTTPDAHVSTTADAAVATWMPECTSDNDCPGQVCSSVGTCLDASEVRDVTATWTYGEYPASTYTCTTANKSTVVFLFDKHSLQPHRGPVPCSTGSYQIKNVPVSIQYLLTEDPSHTYSMTDDYCWEQPASHWIDPDGKVAFDMYYFDYSNYCGL